MNKLLRTLKAFDLLRRSLGSLSSSFFDGSKRLLPSLDHLLSHNDVQRLSHGSLHGHPVLIGHDHPLQLGNLYVLGDEIDGLDVQEGLFDGNDNQISTHDVRPPLVPQRQLTGDLRILIDAGFNLVGPVDQPLLRQLVDNNFPVIRRV